MWTPSVDAYSGSSPGLRVKFFLLVVLRVRAGQSQVGDFVDLLDTNELLALSLRESPAELHVPGLTLLLRRPSAGVWM